jgi:hypothetical protein
MDFIEDFKNVISDAAVDAARDLLSTARTNVQISDAESIGIFALAEYTKSGFQPYPPSEIRDISSFGDDDKLGEIINNIIIEEGYEEDVSYDDVLDTFDKIERFGDDYFKEVKEYAINKLGDSEEAFNDEYFNGKYNPYQYFWGCMYKFMLDYL